MSKDRNFGILLRSKRTIKGFSENELALLLAVPTAVLRRWERGLTRPSAAHVLNICRILDINEQELALAEGGKISTVIAQSGASNVQASASRGKLYTACKWIFFGVFMFFALFSGVYSMKFIQLFIASGFFDNITSVLGYIATGQYYYFYKDFLPFTLFLVAMIVLLMIFAIVMLRITKKGQVVVNRKSTPLAIIGCLLLLLGAVTSLLYMNFSQFNSYTGYSAQIFRPTVAQNLFYIIEILGYIGMLVSRILKKPRLCACFAIPPLLAQGYNIIQSISMAGHLDGIGALMDYYLPFITIFVFMCLFVIKGFLKKARFATPLTLLLIALILYSTYAAIYLFFRSPSTGILTYLGLTLLCASEISYKRSFITDALHCFSKPALYIIGSVITLTLMLRVFYDSSIIALLVTIVIGFSIPICLIFWFAFLLFPDPDKPYTSKKKKQEYVIEVENN